MVDEIKQSWVSDLTMREQHCVALTYKHHKPKLQTLMQKQKYLHTQ